MMVGINTPVFWDIVDRNLLPQSSMQKTPFTLKKEAACFSETLAPNILKTYINFHFPEDKYFQEKKNLVSK